MKHSTEHTKARKEKASETHVQSNPHDTLLSKIEAVLKQHNVQFGHLH